MEQVMDFSVEELIIYLQKRSFDQHETKVLKDNNIEGSLLIRFTRADLTDLYPTSFLTRKKLWDLIEDLRGKETLEDSCGVVPNSQPDDAYPISVGRIGNQHIESTSPKRRLSTSTNVDKSPSSISTESSFTDSPIAGIESDSSSVPKRRKLFASISNVHKGPSSSCTESVKSSNEDNSPDEDFLKRLVIPVTQQLKNFQSNRKQLDDKVRNKFIRECVTCIQVASHGNKISPKEFQLAAKKICKTLPMMRDPEPPNSSKDVVFPYWATVLKLLRKRHYNNAYEGKKRSKTLKDEEMLLVDHAEEDEDDHLREISKEMKKKNPNWTNIYELQKLTFYGRQNYIKALDGKNVVDATFQKYPFLKNEQVLIYEMQLCFKSDISYEEIVSNLKSLAECLKTEEDEEEGLQLENIQREAKLRKPFLVFIPDDLDDIQLFVKTNKALCMSPTLLAYMDECRSTSPQFYISIDKQIQIELDTSNFYRAFITLFSTYHALNLEYEHNTFFKFIEKHVLKQTVKLTMALSKLEKRFFQK